MKTLREYIEILDEISRRDFLKGAGATAEATIGGSGEIASITVTNGGSGYWLVPNAAINTPYYPVAPNNQGAMVIISTGYVVDLFYR